MSATPPLPNRLQVEVTAACNLRCKMCTIGYREAAPARPSMSFDLFEQLLEQLPHLEEVGLQGIGEPLMAPDLYRMVAAATARGVRTNFNTNATLLTEHAGRGLIDAGLSHLTISVDSADEAMYESIRSQARWSIVDRNVTRFVELKRELRSENPGLSLTMVLMRRNLDHIAGVVEQAARWGIRDVFVQGLSHDFSDTTDRSYVEIARFVEAERLSEEDAERVAPAFEQARRTASEGDIRLRLPALEPRPEPLKLPDGTPVGCDWPWHSGYVARDGTVLPCCMLMGDGRASFGDVNEEPFDQIWNLESFAEFRRGLMSNDPPLVCRGCSLYRGTF